MTFLLLDYKVGFQDIFAEFYVSKARFTFNITDAY